MAFSTFTHCYLVLDDGVIWMYRKKFLKLYEALKERVEKEGKKSPDWFLGYVEGFGNQKLTGYQIGALYYLFVLPSAADLEHTEEMNEVVSEGNQTVSIPGVI